MSRIRGAWRLVLALIVDDGFLAVWSLAAIGITYLLTRDSALGSADMAGWVLVGLVAAAMVGSVGRAIHEWQRER